MSATSEQTRGSGDDSIKFNILPSRPPIMSPINFPTDKIGLKKRKG